MFKKTYYDHSAIEKKWPHSAKASRGKQGYNHDLVERKWQKIWLERKLFSPDLKKTKKPFYNLWMFPYPSAEGLHAGHAFASTGSDIYGRFMRMHGRDVFQPIGYDSFGIHAENFALKIEEHPQKMLARATKNYESQFKSMGHGYDWTRTVTTSDVNYYKWTQWLFVQMFKAGLAYKKKASVNWCPGCKTVLADEQIMTPAQAGKIPPGYEKLEDVPEGVRVCERCGNIPQEKELEQWFFRITNYADRLLEGLTKIDWSERVVTAQREWIGKKEGINITYKVKGLDEEITVFTTTPVNWGATFLVVAPDHALVKKILAGDIKVNKKIYSEVSKYIAKTLDKTEQQRREGIREKSGVFTGFYAINHANGKEIPVWISNFVLIEVGTGAIQGCPGHDRRDFEFAKKYNLPILRVVVGPDGDKSEIDSVGKVISSGMPGKMINSDFLDGMEFGQAMQATMNFFEKKSWGKKAIKYHLRDWLISRQRYWGPPIPMIYCPNCAERGECWFSKVRQVCPADWNSTGWYPEENLPIELPIITDYQPEGEGKGPLANHPEFYKTTCPSCGREATRETDVSDTFVDSSWYFLRYPSTRSARSGQVPFDPEITKKWLPVNLYFGGAEHAVLHLMYARFVTMVLHDLKLIDFEEPFPKFYAHGLMIKDGAKMSKSRGNVVNPDEYIAKFGADTLRLYLMFMGPMDGNPDFRDTGIEGMYRFILRLWRLFTEYRDVILTEEKDSQEVLIKMHQTIKKVTNDIENFRYNVALAAIMEFVNLLYEKIKNSATRSSLLRGPSAVKCAEWDEALKTLCLLLAPLAPHMTEEIYQRYYAGNSKFQIPNSKFVSVHFQPWPKYVEELTKVSRVTIPVQIDGKLRAQLDLRSQIADLRSQVERRAKANEKVKRWLKDKKIKKVVFVSGRLINFVTKNPS